MRLVTNVAIKCPKIDQNLQLMNTFSKIIQLKDIRFFLLSARELRVTQIKSNYRIETAQELYFCHVKYINAHELTFSKIILKNQRITIACNDIDLCKYSHTVKKFAAVADLKHCTRTYLKPTASDNIGATSPLDPLQRKTTLILLDIQRNHTTF